MRWSRALVAAMFVLAVGACSTPAASSDDGNGDGNGNGGSSNPPASRAAPQSQDDGNGGNGGNGGSAGDADAVFNALIPPNSTEISKTTAASTYFATYTSTDSVESLTSHYESAIPGAGMQIFSTTNAQGGTAWVFAENEGSSFGGSVSVYPETDGGGASVIIAVASDS
jgi:hypothetical protein